MSVCHGVICSLPYLKSPGCFLHSSALFYSGWDGLSSKSWWSAAALMWSPWWRFVCDPVTTSHGPKRTETVGCAIEVHPGLTSCCWLYPARQTPASLITGGRLTFWSAASILDGLRTWMMWAAQGLLHCRSAGLETLHMHQSGKWTSPTRHRDCWRSSSKWFINVYTYKSFPSLFPPWNKKNKKDHCNFFIS